MNKSKYAYIYIIYIDLYLYIWQCIYCQEWDGHKRGCRVVVVCSWGLRDRLRHEDTFCGNGNVLFIEWDGIYMVIDIHQYPLIKMCAFYYM